MVTAQCVQSQRDVSSHWVSFVSTAQRGLCRRRTMSACPFVCLSHAGILWKHILKLFTPSDSHTVLVFATNQCGTNLTGTP